MRPYKSMGEPEGDPFAGPAYGDKNRKFFKAALAVVSIVAAIPTGGASLTLLGGLAIAGGALSLVGIATGNKTLGMIGTAMTVGAGLGAAFTKLGGISGITKSFSGVTGTTGASNLDLVKAASNSVGKASDVGAAVAGVADDVGGLASNYGKGLAGGSGTSVFDAAKAGYVSDAANANFGGMQAIADSGGVSSAVANTSSAASNAGLDLIGQNTFGQAAANAPNQIAGSSFLAGGKAVTPAVGASTGVIDGMLPITDMSMAPLGLLGQAKEGFSGLMQSLNNNPVTTKLVGDFIQGSYQSPQDKAKAQAMIDYYNQQTNVSQQQQANAQAIPTLNLSANPAAKVQFNTTIRAPAGMGLLNRSQPI